MGKDVIIALDFDSKEKTLAFLDRFTGEKPFVKIGMEPWNGWANSVNEDGKHEVLEPDEAMTSEWSITIEKA